MSDDILQKFIKPKPVQKDPEDEPWLKSLKYWLGILQFIFILSILSQIFLWCTDG
jgi:hypothetical protein